MLCLLLFVQPRLGRGFVFFTLDFRGIGSNVHVIVVDRKGFEHWPRSERQDSLCDFIHAKLNLNDELFISRLRAMTEEEYESYEGFEV